MNKLSQLVLVAGLCLSLNGYAVGITITTCTHGGTQYSIGTGGVCPDYVGDDAGTSHPSPWVHTHKADNSEAYYELDDMREYEESPGHCEVAKTQKFEDTGL